MKPRMTTEEFIKRAREVHGDKYDYSRVEYLNNTTPVIIKCPEHGEFLQVPYVHLRGSGCQKCNGTEKLTTEEFIKRARRVHGDKYDYSKVEYVGNHDNVCIICPKHGEFMQTPHAHLNGQGCPVCGGTKKMTTEEFIKRAREKHGDKYDYSRAEYVNAHAKLCIVCPEHGEFWQAPHKHLQNQGCPVCGVKKKTSNREEFIKKAIEVHGDKYDYSRVVYVNAMKKICIVCPIHGEFWQRPQEHLYNNGCPYCRESKLEKFIKKVLKKNHISFDPQKKFILQKLINAILKS